MKKYYFVLALLCAAFTMSAQAVLINFNFQSATLSTGVMHNGTTNLTKAADGVCTVGMVQLNGGVTPVQFMQIDVPSCTAFTFNAKSTSTTARLTTIKYKKQSDPAYTTLTTTLSVQVAATFNLTTLFPVLVSTKPINVRIEAGGNIQVHDLYVTDNASVIACWGLKSLNNEYDDSGLTATIVGQVKPEMINPSGLSVKFDELTEPNFTYVPSNDYNYTADLLPAQAVRVLIPLYAGAEKVAWNVNCGVVPLNLIDFLVKKQKDNVVIAWKTANEIAASHFKIEKSGDGKTFAPIGEVKARNTASVNDYTFTNNTPSVKFSISA